MPYDELLCTPPYYPGLVPGSGSAQRLSKGGFAAPPDRGLRHDGHSWEVMQGVNAKAQRRQAFRAVLGALGSWRFILAVVVAHVAAFAAQEAK